MGNRDFDFAGWVTKNDIQCSDGVTIKHDAFRDNDGQKVPLVWNHDYNSPLNVLGHVILQHRDEGVYGYGYFNDSEHAQGARAQVIHGDIQAMSIGARKLKRNGSNIIHGSIYEVSLVLAGANPGAMIDTILRHAETGEEEAHIWTDNLIHSAEAIADMQQAAVETKKEEKEVAVKEDNLQHAELTIEQIIDTMNDTQKDAVYALLGLVAADNDEVTQSDDDVYQSNEGDGKGMKHNVFATAEEVVKTQEVKENYNEILQHALVGKASSLRDFLAEADDTLTHGINSIEMLFPDAAQSTNGNVPILYKDTNTGYEEILSGVAKSPFSRVKTLVADLTEEEARAKGYIKGSMKKEEFFSLIKRTTAPTTVYKKQKLDRDDIIDITDFDVVSFMNVEMQMMLKEEIARALLVGDGRDYSSDDKISESNIRPIISDHEFFTIQKTFETADKFIEAVIMSMAEYKGSGRPNMYIDPTLLSSIKLLRANDGRFLFGEIPSDEGVANRLGLNKIVPTTFMSGKGAVIVNLRDYTLGASKGGQITNFDDFDIDFNQYKYLIETRLSGALTTPKSAIHLIAGTTPATGANNEAGGVTYGGRQADKTATPEA